jgi:hypothetical protein
MKPIAIVLVFAAIGLSRPALAQPSGNAGANAPAPAGSEAAPAQPTAAQLAAAMDLLDANGSITSMGAMLDSLAPIEAEQIRREHPEIDIATSAKVLTAVRNEIVSREDEYKRIVAAVYARHFSEDELRKLAAFYRSDVGRKYIEMLPVLIKEVTPVGASWAAGVAVDAVRKVLKTMDNSRQHA